MTEVCLATNPSSKTGFKADNADSHQVPASATTSKKKHWPLLIKSPPVHQTNCVLRKRNNENLATRRFQHYFFHLPCFTASHRFSATGSGDTCYQAYATGTFIASRQVATAEIPVWPAENAVCRVAHQPL
jgi:hypothetical protein